MSSKLPVVAAIPNYNMAPQLAELLPQVVEQDYAAVFVLDDASTDNSREVAADFNASVRVIAGAENVGSGGNRNRIIPVLGTKAIIHFIDADTQLETERMPEVAQDLMPTGPLGFVGGLVKDTDGYQLAFNYGPRQCLRTWFTAQLQMRICDGIVENPEKVAHLRERYQDLLQDWPDPTREPQARPVFWSLEANLLIDSEVFSAIGGFDPKLRDHDIQDLAIRIQKLGLARRFDPSLSVVHTEAQVRSGNRALSMGKAEFQIARKHGFHDYILPDGKFNPAL